MHIQKVLNSSVVLVQDDSGEESILLGKGIGYGRKAGEPIERQPSDRVFLPLSNPDAQPMLELFSSIPASYLELTQDIVDDAEPDKTSGYFLPIDPTGTPENQPSPWFSAFCKRISGVCRVTFSKQRRFFYGIL